MTRLLDLPDPLALRRTHGLFEDFLWHISPHLWTSLVADSGSSAAIAAGAGGIVALGTGATDNNEVEIKTTNSPFLFAEDKPLIFEARLQFSEAATNAANVMVGVMDAVGADALLDNGGGPKASYSGAVIFKVDGGTVWKTETSIGAAKTTNASTRTAGGAAYQTLTVEFRPITATLAEVLFYVDGAPLRDASNNVLKHALTFSGAVAMQAFVAVKAGGANAESVNVDYLACYQLR